MTPERSYDFVLFGATGFTGRLTALYLATHAPAQARWALAGRSPEKLAQIRREIASIAPQFGQLDLLVADSADAASLQRVAQSARVVVSTVGPYILYGEPLVAACAAAGTHYLDLTGEPEFVDTMWLKCHELASSSGAKLVHACGFDSIPHDLGAYFAVQQLPANGPIKLSGYVSARGSFSAGTFHSALYAFSRLRQTAQAAKERTRRELALVPRVSTRRVSGIHRGIHRQAELGSAWLLPMPTIDPQIVKRSARALDLYGPNFRYGHFLVLPKFRHVVFLSLGMASLMVMAQVPPLLRWLLARKSSGQGPSEARRAKSSFCISFLGQTKDQNIVVQVSGGDPGYGETSKMLGEATLSLAFDDLPALSGQLTPAQAMGQHLLDRLIQAGLSFKLLKKTPQA